MKRLLGIILLTTMCTVLPAGQEVTGKALKTAFKEYNKASSDSDIFERLSQFLSGEMHGYNKILALFNEEGATRDSVKEKIKNDRDALDKSLDKRHKDERKLFDKTHETFDHLDTLINMAAQKLD